MRKEPFVTVGYLGGLQYVSEPWAWSLLRMIQFTQEECDFGIELQRAQSSYHSYARDWLAANMHGDWLLQLDCDHEFEPDLLARMLNTAQERDALVVTGLYQTKVPPHLPVLYSWKRDDAGRIDSSRVNPIVTWETPVFEVDAAGGGCLLVHWSVFDKIRMELEETPFGIRHPRSEDVSFFDRLRVLGIPAVVDTRIRCRHLGVKAIDLEDMDLSDFRTCEREVISRG